MKIRFLVLCLCTLANTKSFGQSPDDYTNTVRQIQIPSGVKWDLPVERVGERESYLEIGDAGARFELWTVLSEPFVAYLLDSTYVGSYIPTATIVITTEDPDTYNVVPRTRADRPFRVEIVTNGLRDGDKDPEASKKVSLLRHVQSYGAGGVGKDLDPTQAILEGKAVLKSNDTFVLNYGLSAIPGGNRAKIRGEERFSVYSLDDKREKYVVPGSQLASQKIQIWPVADGTISGIKPGETIRFKLPQLTFTLNDLYPSSSTYAQVYKGPEALGTIGTRFAGFGLEVNDGAPRNETGVIKDYDDALPEDGEWTIELLTKTPFGIDRLAYVTFHLDRTLKVRGSMNTHE